MPTFALAIKQKGSVAQLNRASDYGSEGCRFESCIGHYREAGEAIPKRSHQVWVHDSVAQLVEQLTLNQWVESSSLSGVTI